MEYRRKNAERQKRAQAKEKEQRRILNIQKLFIRRHGLDTFDESTVKYLDIGQMNFSCVQCGSLMFKDEKHERRLCCSNGAVKLPPVKDPPKFLQKLLMGNSKID